MKKNTQNTETTDELSCLPYKHCLNCGTELKGKYCHRCGQKAVKKTPSIGSFIHEYLDHAIKWDHQFFSTFWTLIRRPGHLTNEYNAGKFVSQEHPLKLNMFLLLIFVTMFVFFASGKKINDSVYGLLNDEHVYSSLQLDMVIDDTAYSNKIKESPRDTIRLQAPLLFSEEFPHLVGHVETIEDNNDDDLLDKWVAVVPRVFIEDELLIIDDSGYYRFNKEAKIEGMGASLIISLWEMMGDITSHYFPILLLLTTPFLSCSIALIHRRRKIPRINHFVFALHYTAFLEFLMIFIYILYLTNIPSMFFLENMLMIYAFLYMTIAYHRVYASSWVKSAIKSLMTGIIYLTILIFIFVIIFFIACTIVMANIQ